jgi:UDPglucose 6-dehydrogenase
MTVVDRDEARIAQWNSKHLPVHEPGLNRIVRVTRDGTNAGSYISGNPAMGNLRIPSRHPNLSFSTDVEGALAVADIVFVSVNTPTKLTGLGAGAATNLADFENVIVTVAQYVRPGCIVVEKSTVPCGTAQIVRKIVSCSLVESASEKNKLTFRSWLATAKMIMFKCFLRLNFWQKAPL